jgi:hypothetical protein
MLEQVVHVQGDSGEKVSLSGGESTGHCEEKVRMNTYLILNGHRDKAV